MKKILKYAGFYSLLILYYLFSATVIIIIFFTGAGLVKLYLMSLFVIGLPPFVLRFFMNKLYPGIKKQKISKTVSIVSLVIFILKFIKIYSNGRFYPYEIPITAFELAFVLSLFFYKPPKMYSISSQFNNPESGYK